MNKNNEKLKKQENEEKIYILIHFFIFLLSLILYFI